MSCIYKPVNASINYILEGEKTSDGYILTAK